MKDEHGRHVAGVGRLVGFSAITFVAAVGALLYGASRGGEHGAVYVVLGILIVASNIALWLAVAMSQWKRRGLEPRLDVTAEKPQNRPAQLDSTTSVVVLFGAAGMWAYFTAAAFARNAYAVAALQGPHAHRHRLDDHANPSTAAGAAELSWALTIDQRVQPGSTIVVRLPTPLTRG